MDLTALRRDIALACRVLAHQGLAADVLGHVSVRAGTGRLLVRCRGPQESGLLFSTPDDVHLVDLDGPYDGLTGGYSVPGELAIHTATLRHRPDVTAVVHAHPPAVVAADLAGLPLRPIVGAFNIPAARLARDGVPVYPRGVLIRRAELAAEMLDAMGTAPACVLRGHGVTTVGTSIAEAVVRALDLEALARLTLDVAQAGGRPRDLPDEDLAELPDLGAALNVESKWRHQLARMDQAGLLP